MSVGIKAPKKRIEVALPLDDINVVSGREKSIRHGHPSTLHLWWARRPLPRHGRCCSPDWVGLAANGVQVIIATHSLFVLREIEILMGDQRFRGLPTRFIALAPGNQGVQASSGDRPEDVESIAALDAGSTLVRSKSRPRTRTASTIPPSERCGRTARYTSSAAGRVMASVWLPRTRPHTLLSISDKTDNLRTLSDHPARPLTHHVFPGS